MNHKGEAVDVRKAKTLHIDRGEIGVNESFAVRYRAAAERYLVCQRELLVRVPMAARDVPCPLHNNHQSSTRTSEE